MSRDYPKGVEGFVGPSEGPGPCAPEPIDQLNARTERFCEETRELIGAAGISQEVFDRVLAEECLEMATRIRVRLLKP